MITFEQEDFNYVYFHGDPQLPRILKNRYSFYANGYKFHPLYKTGVWNGKLSLVDLEKSRLPAGILYDVIDFLDESKIKFNLKTYDNEYWGNINDEDVKRIYSDSKSPFEPFESQISAVIHSLKTKRNIVIAPTSNGKSYIIHGILYHHFMKKRKTLLIVHSTQLVKQLAENFTAEYNCPYKVATIYDKDLNLKKVDVLITTWQSIYKNKDSFFKSFNCMIIDELHRATAKSFKDIVKKSDDVEFRHGFTATLSNGSKLNELTLIGMFGKPLKTTTLQKQIEQGLSSDVNVFIFDLKYSDSDVKRLIRIKDIAIDDAKGSGQNNGAIAFRAEEDFVETHHSRQDKIIDAVLSLKGNNLVAFKHREHGKLLAMLLKKKTDRKVFFIDGSVNKNLRFEYQKEISNSENSIVVASLGTFSTGINIPNLNNLFITSTLKSQITIPQLIGRMVRVTENKNKINVIDFFDDLGNNILKNHCSVRLEHYIKNQFKIKRKVISL